MSADPTGTNPPSDARSPQPSNWYAQQWSHLCEVLEVSDPSEVVPRVQTLKRNLDRLDQGNRNPAEGLVTISEVEDVFQEMNEKMKTLRERNAALSDRLKQEDEDIQSARQELYQKAEQLLDSLDATTMEEARQRIKKLNRRLVALYQEKERIVQAGFEDASEVTEALEQLRKERDHLQTKCEDLKAECHHLKQKLDQTEERSAPSKTTRPDPDTSVLEAAVAIRDTIGVSSPDEAIAFYRVIEKLYEQIRRRAESLGVTAEEPSDNVFDMLHSIAKLLRALPNPEAVRSEGIPSKVATDVLGTTQPEEIHALANTARRLREHLFALHGNSLENEIETELSESTNVLTLLQHLEKSLKTARTSPMNGSSSSSRTEVGDGLPSHTVNDVYQAENPSRDRQVEANETNAANAACRQKSIEHQLEALYREKEILLQHGFHNAQEVVERLRTQQEDIEGLQRENHVYERRFAQLEMELGTARISSLIGAVRSLEAETNTSVVDIVEGDPNKPRASGSQKYGTNVKACAPIVSSETLDNLQNMTEQELDALDVGLLRLSEDGTVEYANREALQLPGLQSVESPDRVLGGNFFTDIAPCTNTPSFRGRFLEGQRQEVLDARFPYTFIHPDREPGAYTIHLHRKPRQKTTWMLFCSL